MDNVLLFKKDLENYSQSSLLLLAKYLGIDATDTNDLRWLLAVRQAENYKRGSMNGKHTAYIVAGSPGAGKSTVIDHLHQNGIIPKNILIIDRDHIAEESTDIIEKSKEIVKNHNVNQDSIDVQLHQLMAEKYRSVYNTFYSKIDAAINNGVDFLTFVPPFTINPAKMANYNIILIYIDTDINTAKIRVKDRQRKRPWLALSEIDVVCGWNAAVYAVEKYCLTGKCYICDNMGRKIKCFPLNQYPKKLPTAEEASNICRLTKENAYDSRKVHKIASTLNVIDASYIE